MNNNQSQTSDLEILTRLLKEDIEEEGELSRSDIQFLFDDMYIYSVQDGVASIAVPSIFMRDHYYRKKIDELIKNHLSRMLGMDLEVNVFVDQSITPPPEMQMFGYLRMKEEEMAKAEGMTLEEYQEYKRKLYGEAPKTSSASSDGALTLEGEMEIGISHVERDENGNEKRRFISAEELSRLAEAEPVTYKEDYTFENFVVGDSNKVAHAFAQVVAENPGERKHNPLFIYGPPGVGKTHLMYAISNRILEKSPNKRIEYVKGEDFVNMFIEMIRDGRAVEFREKYRGADMLIIDDVQYIAGKDSTEEELFHTFNTLFEDNKQIVFTADKLPRDMSKLSKRLESRLEGGVMADIQLPGYELRLAILRSKAQTSGLNLSGDVEDFLAKRLTSSIRQIEGVIKKLSGMKFVVGGDMTVDSVRQMVPEYLSDAVPTEDFVKNVIAACAEYYEVKPEDLTGERRDKNIQTARNAAMYIIRANTNLSTKNIGEIFGGRKHTTVISNCRTVEEMIEKKPSYAAEIEQMERNSKA